MRVMLPFGGTTRIQEIRTWAEDNMDDVPAARSTPVASTSDQYRWGPDVGV
jgi:hypothetical protein